MRTRRNLFHAKRQQMCSTQAPAAAGPAPSTSSGALIVCNAISVQPETRAPCCAYAQVCLQAAAWRAGICCWCASLPGPRKPLVPRVLLSCSRQCGTPPPLSALASTAARCRTPRGLPLGRRWAGAHARPARALLLQAAPARRRVGRWTAAGGGRRGAGERRAPPSLVYTPRLRSVRLFAEEGKKQQR